MVKAMLRLLLAGRNIDRDCAGASAFVCTRAYGWRIDLPQARSGC